MEITKEVNEDVYTCYVDNARGYRIEISLKESVAIELRDALNKALVDTNK